MMKRESHTASEELERSDATDRREDNSPEKRETTLSTTSSSAPAGNIRTSRNLLRLPPMINTPASYNATKPPKQTLQAVYDAGKYKAALTLDVLAVQSFMAGVYIAMAGQLFLSLGGGVLGSAFFPTGLIAVVLTSGELFTGDALVFVASLLGGHVSAKSMLRNWVVSWCFNFIGCLAWAFLLGYCSDALADLDKVDYAIAVALKKNGQSWLGTFLKGIGANFMVCLGVWQATCAQEVAGKILALWFPVAGFVAMGFDHCIADQFLVPMGMMLGADVSMFDLFFGILAPATLGNIVGGGIFVGAVYWYVFDSMESFNAFRVRIRQGWNALPSQRSSHAKHQASGEDSPRSASECGLEIP
jgi:formate/nitrite transporter